MFLNIRRDVTFLREYLSFRVGYLSGKSFCEYTTRMGSIARHSKGLDIFMASLHYHLNNVRLLVIEFEIKDTRQHFMHYATLKR